MDYSTVLSRYAFNWTKVEELRAKSFLGRHILSLPYQWSKKHYARLTCDILDDIPALPLLGVSGDPDLVVSLTSFPGRIDGLHLVIKSLLLQDLLPGRIILWLADEEFPEGIADVPESLRELQENGLEINFVPDNYRSHNKYYYVFRQYPGKVIVTVDDDMIYNRDMFSRLIRLHRIYPGAVCANRVRLIAYEGDQAHPYRKWSGLEPDSDSESKAFLALGNGGILYPTGDYRIAACDPGLFTELSPLSDDLWLKAVELSMGVCVATGGSHYVSPVDVPGSQRMTLDRFARRPDINCEQWGRLDGHFSLRDRFD